MYIEFLSKNFYFTITYAKLPQKFSTLQWVHRRAWPVNRLNVRRCRPMVYPDGEHVYACRRGASMQAPVCPIRRRSCARI